MKTSPTMVPVLLLLIAFGCFLAAPAVLAEGPWDGENSGGNQPLHGSTTTVHDNDDLPGDINAILRGSEHRQGGDWFLGLFYEVTLKLVIDFYVIPGSTNQVVNATMERPSASTSNGVGMSHQAAK